MDNHNSATGYINTNMEDFKMEIISLMKKVQGIIDSSASKIKVSEGSPSKRATKNISVLKIQEFKLKEILSRVEPMEEEEWSGKRETLVKDFEEIHEDFQPHITR